MGSVPRYSRLARYSGFAVSLPRWQAARIAIVGLGGLGSGLALQLARWGAGSQGEGALRLIDRDIVESANLGYQALYYEAQAQAGYPKAMAAQHTLEHINSAVRCEAWSADLTRSNIRELLNGCELIFDGLDNYYGRLLLNDYALAAGIPYFYAGVVRGELSVKAVVPGSSSCLRCFLREPPAAGSLPTCSSEGVFPPLLQMANTLQLELANRWLSGSFTENDGDWFAFNTSDLRLQRGPAPKSPDCPACAGRHEFLDGGKYDDAARACSEGHLEQQLNEPVDLKELAMRIESSPAFALSYNRYCITARRGAETYTIFPSGRVIMAGSDDPLLLRRFIAEQLGV